MTSTGNSLGGQQDVKQEEFRYGEHELQSLTVFHPFENRPEKLDGIWIIYIHGGAWRDPKVTDKSLLPAIQTLLSEPEQQDLLKDNVAAFASVSYRLSAHPSFPQDADTPASQLRNATHPDHITDVLSSIEFLQSRFHFGNRYMLVGHSCGATLALQTIMNKYIIGPRSFPNFKSPEVIVGVAGIYDMRLLCDCHENAAYNDFTVGAFGSDEDAWDWLSPAKFQWFKESWPEAKLLALISSKGDELVDEKQIEVMIDKSRDLSGTTKLEVIKDLQERHNDIWEKGTEMAFIIDTVLKRYLNIAKKSDSI